MPKELIAPAVGHLAFREFERPDLRAGYVRVKSLFGAAKHGTEMALFKGYALARGSYDNEYQIFRSGTEMVRYPIALGNTCVGEVIEVGAEVTLLKKGDIVFRYGPFRDEHVWPETVRKLPPGVPWQ